MAAEPARAFAAPVSRTRFGGAGWSRRPGSGAGARKRLRRRARRGARPLAATPPENRRIHARAARRSLRSEDRARRTAVPERSWPARRRHCRPDHARSPRHAVERPVPGRRLRRRRVRAGTRTAATAAPRRVQPRTDRWPLRPPHRECCPPLPGGAWAPGRWGRRPSHVRRTPAHGACAAACAPISAAHASDGAFPSAADGSPEIVAPSCTAIRSAGHDGSTARAPDQPVMAGSACSGRSDLSRGARWWRAARRASPSDLEGCGGAAIRRGDRGRWSGRPRRRLGRTRACGGSGARLPQCRSAGRCISRVQPRRDPRAPR